MRYLTMEGFIEQCHTFDYSKSYETSGFTPKGADQDFCYVLERRIVYQDQPGTVHTEARFYRAKGTLRVQYASRVQVLGSDRSPVTLTLHCDFKSNVTKHLKTIRAALEALSVKY